MFECVSWAAVNLHQNGNKEKKSKQTSMIWGERIPMSMARTVGVRVWTSTNRYIPHNYEH